ncbi:hypothetical protein [Chlorobium sp. N1]|uniref:hypothetical protein n=1 Tax=Chlorobium sp. N1 TaxID=2491138 RepID=UPI001039BC27|nr:hypothetical protein [Chlorobium sp. N1]TCD47130.1 hypothetical protein E0L29_09460 [Chlorobium sp. N1]
MKSVEEKLKNMEAWVNSLKGKVIIFSVSIAMFLGSYTIWYFANGGYEGQVLRDEQSRIEAKQREIDRAAADEARRNRWQSKDNSSTAYVMLQDHVRGRLKAPSTAKFPWMGGTDVIVIREGQEYTVHSYVDSQNSFGAMIRNSYTGRMRQVSEYGWQFVSLEFD